MEEKCQAGCMIFTGGEIKHDKNCVFYPESRTKMYEDLESDLENWQSTAKELAEVLSSIENDKSEIPNTIWEMRNATLQNYKKLSDGK